MGDQGNSRLLVNGTLLTPGGETKGAAIAVVNGRIAYAGAVSRLPESLSGYDFEQVESRRLPVIDAAGGYFSPGFIDVHVHGGGGADVMDSSVAALRQMALTHAAQGTTGLLATTVTADLAAMKRAAAAVALAMDEQEKAPAGPWSGAAVLGLHLEGPYVNPEKRGAQNAAYMRPASTSELAEVMEVLQQPQRLRLITMAPEMPGALHAVRWLRDRGVTVSMGHTDATFAEAIAGIEAGITHATHCFNAMRGLHHREPGVLGAAMLDRRVTAELIADGIHVHPGSMRVLYETKGAERIALITDAVRAMGMPDGAYELGALRIRLQDGAVRLEDGTLAGSALSTIQAVRNAVQVVGIPLGEAVHMASLNPARSVGLDQRKGSIAHGKDADILVLGDDLALQLTMVQGRIAFVETNSAIRLKDAGSPLWANQEGPVDGLGGTAQATGGTVEQ